MKRGCAMRAPQRKKRASLISGKECLLDTALKGQIDLPQAFLRNNYAADYESDFKQGLLARFVFSGQQVGPEVPLPVTKGLNRRHEPTGNISWKHKLRVSGQVRQLLPRHVWVTTIEATGPKHITVKLQTCQQAQQEQEKHKLQEQTRSSVLQPNKQQPCTIGATANSHTQQQQQRAVRAGAAAASVVPMSPVGGPGAVKAQAAAKVRSAATSRARSAHMQQHAAAAQPAALTAVEPAAKRMRLGTGGVGVTAKPTASAVGRAAAALQSPALDGVTYSNARDQPAAVAQGKAPAAAAAAQKIDVQHASSSSNGWQPMEYRIGTNTGTLPLNSNLADKLMQKQQQLQQADQHAQGPSQVYVQLLLDQSQQPKQPRQQQQADKQQYNKQQQQQQSSPWMLCELRQQQQQPAAGSPASPSYQVTSKQLQQQLQRHTDWRTVAVRLTMSCNLQYRLQRGAAGAGPKQQHQQQQQQRQQSGGNSAGVHLTNKHRSQSPGAGETAAAKNTHQQRPPGSAGVQQQQQQQRQQQTAAFKPPAAAAAVERNSDSPVARSSLSPITTAKQRKQPSSAGLQHQDKQQQQQQPHDLQPQEQLQQTPPLLQQQQEKPQQQPAALQQRGEQLQRLPRHHVVQQGQQQQQLPPPQQQQQQQRGQQEEPRQRRDRRPRSQSRCISVAAAEPANQAAAATADACLPHNESVESDRFSDSPLNDTHSTSDEDFTVDLDDMPSDKFDGYSDEAENLNDLEILSQGFWGPSGATQQQQQQQRDGPVEAVQDQRRLRRQSQQGLAELSVSPQQQQQQQQHDGSGTDLQQDQQLQQQQQQQQRLRHRRLSHPRGVGEQQEPQQLSADTAQQGSPGPQQQQQQAGQQQQQQQPQSQPHMRESPQQLQSGLRDEKLESESLHDAPAAGSGAGRKQSQTPAAARHSSRTGNHNGRTTGGSRAAAAGAGAGGGLDGDGGDDGDDNINPNDSQGAASDAAVQSAAVSYFVTMNQQVQNRAASTISVFIPRVLVEVALPQIHRLAVGKSTQMNVKLLLLEPGTEASVLLNAESQGVTPLGGAQVSIVRVKQKSSNRTTNTPIVNYALEDMTVGQQGELYAIGITTYDQCQGLNIMVSQTKAGGRAVRSRGDVMALTATGRVVPAVELLADSLQAAAAAAGSAPTQPAATAPAAAFTEAAATAGPTGAAAAAASVDEPGAGAGSAAGAAADAVTFGPYMPMKQQLARHRQFLLPKAFVRAHMDELDSMEKGEGLPLDVTMALLPPGVTDGKLVDQVVETYQTQLMVSLHAEDTLNRYFISGRGLSKCPYMIGYYYIAGVYKLSETAVQFMVSDTRPPDRGRRTSAAAGEVLSPQSSGAAAAAAGAGAGDLAGADLASIDLASADLDDDDDDDDVVIVDDVSADLADADVADADLAAEDAAAEAAAEQAAAADQIASAAGAADTVGSAGLEQALECEPGPLFPVVQTLFRDGRFHYPRLPNSFTIQHFPLIRQHSGSTFESAIPLAVQLVLLPPGATEITADTQPLHMTNLTCCRAATWRHQTKENGDKTELRHISLVSQLRQWQSDTGNVYLVGLRPIGPQGVQLLLSRQLPPDVTPKYFSISPQALQRRQSATAAAGGLRSPRQEAGSQPRKQLAGKLLPRLGSGAVGPGLLQHQQSGGHLGVVSPSSGPADQRQQQQQGVARSSQGQLTQQESDLENDANQRNKGHLSGAAADGVDRRLSSDGMLPPPGAVGQQQQQQQQRQQHTRSRPGAFRSELGDAVIEDARNQHQRNQQHPGHAAVVQTADGALLNEVGGAVATMDLDSTPAAAAAHDALQQTAADPAAEADQLAAAAEDVDMPDAEDAAAHPMQQQQQQDDELQHAAHPAALVLCDPVPVTSSIRIRYHTTVTLQGLKIPFEDFSGLLDVVPDLNPLFSGDAKSLAVQFMHDKGLLAGPVVCTIMALKEGHARLHAINALDDRILGDETFDALIKRFDKYSVTAMSAATAAKDVGDFEGPLDLLCLHVAPPAPAELQPQAAAAAAGGARGPESAPPAGGVLPAGSTQLQQHPELLMEPAAAAAAAGHEHIELKPEPMAVDQSAQQQQQQTLRIGQVPVSSRQQQSRQGYHTLQQQHQQQSFGGDQLPGVRQQQQQECQSMPVPVKQEDQHESQLVDQQWQQQHGQRTDDLRGSPFFAAAAAAAAAGASPGITPQQSLLMQSVPQQQGSGNQQELNGPGPAGSGVPPAAAAAAAGVAGGVLHSAAGAAAGGGSSGGPVSSSGAGTSAAGAPPSQQQQQQLSNSSQPGDIALQLPDAQELTDDVLDALMSASHKLVELGHITPKKAADFDECLVSIQSDEVAAAEFMKKKYKILKFAFKPGKEKIAVEHISRVIKEWQKSTQES